MQSNNNSSGFMHQMNVTPFIDVMLVLLVIFMMTSSVMIAELQVNLPASSAAQERIVQDNNALFVDILKSGSILVQSKLVNEQDFAAEVKKISQSNERTAVIINADAEVSYGHVITVMDTLKKNGVHRVSLSTKGRNGGQDYSK